MLKIKCTWMWLWTATLLVSGFGFGLYAGVRWWTRKMEGGVLAFTEAHRPGWRCSILQCSLVMWCTKGNAIEALCQWAAGFQSTAGRKHKCRDGRLHDVDAHSVMCTVWLQGASPALQRYLCGPGGGCALQDHFCMNGCGLKGICGLCVWHVLAAPPWPQITPRDHSWLHCSNWEQRDLNYLSLSWIKEASIAATYDGKHKWRTI